MHWLLAVAILSEVVATSALKAAEGFTRGIPSLLVVLGYGLSFHFLSLTLRSVPLGIAYAICLVLESRWFLWLVGLSIINRLTPPPLPALHSSLRGSGPEPVLQGPH
jgi:small multidrug resistance pump